MIGVLWYFVKLVFGLDEEHHPVKIFLLLSSIWLVPLSISIASHNALDNSGQIALLLNGAYVVSVSMAVFFTFYFIIYYIKQLMLSWKENKK